jgi:hypothetical protein
MKLLNLTVCLFYTLSASAQIQTTTTIQLNAGDSRTLPENMPYIL